MFLVFHLSRIQNNQFEYNNSKYSIDFNWKNGLATNDAEKEKLLFSSSTDTDNQIERNIEEEIMNKHEFKDEFDGAFEKQR
jgi:hypothetical protein